MNIRFLAQFEYFNAVHFKDDIILEKEYEVGPFENIPKVRYYLYFLEENVRKEVAPHSDKVDIFEITNCVHHSDFIYFTEYDKDVNGGYIFNIIRYNITDHTFGKIITLRDDINLYPNHKQIKIFVLDDQNLIIQRALPKVSDSDPDKYGFHKFSQIVFNFVKNKQIVIHNSNLVDNGIDYIIPYSENNCIMKTGYPVFDQGVVTEDDAAVESIVTLNIQQFLSDLQLEQQNVVYNNIDQCFFDSTIGKAKIQGGYLIYSKYNHDDDEENTIFYDLETKETFTCINKTSHKHSLINYATVIDNVPYMLMKKSYGTEFLNLMTDEIENTYPPEYNIEYINNTTVVASFKEKNIWNKEKTGVAIIKYPGKKVVLQEDGIYIGAIASNDETTYIFLE